MFTLQPAARVLSVTCCSIMPVDVNLEALREELHAAREELDSWTHTLASETKKAKHEHEAAMARARAESQALVEREEALSLQVAALAESAPGSALRCFRSRVTRRAGCGRG